MTAPDHTYETSGDRASLAREAGVGKLSFISVLAGTLVAYGAFAVLAALAGAAAAIGLTNDLSTNDWARLGTGSAIAGAIVLLVAYLFGGYVAGRMARRAGLLNGLAAMLIGALVGGVLGERWHSKLTRRAVSGKYRPDGGDRQPGDDEHPPATPARYPDDQDADGQGRSEHGRSGGGGASRLD